MDLRWLTNLEFITDLGICIEVFGILPLIPTILYLFYWREGHFFTPMIWGELYVKLTFNFIGEGAWGAG